jgi:NADP-dependent 3-hydroxy acid dehydrogenase YdfG
MGIIMKIEGSAAVITGASSGIGLALARSFAEEGAAVVLAARSGEKLAAVADALRQRGGEALAVATDVTQRDQIERLIESAMQRYGRLGILVNNAGRGAAGHVANAPAAHYRVHAPGAALATASFDGGQR